MGKLTIQKWQCDRCLLVCDDPPPIGRLDRIELVMGGEVLGLMVWKDLCGTCHPLAQKLITDAMVAAKEDRAAIAKMQPEYDRPRSIPVLPPAAPISLSGVSRD